MSRAVPRRSQARVKDQEMPQEPESSASASLAVDSGGFGYVDPGEVGPLFEGIYTPDLSYIDSKAGDNILLRPEDSVRVLSHYLGEFKAKGESIGEHLKSLPWERIEEDLEETDGSILMTFESTEYGVVDEDNFEEHRIIHRHGDNVGQVPSQLLEYIAEESPVSSNVAYLEDVNYFEEGQNQLDALLFH